MSGYILTYPIHLFWLNKESREQLFINSDWYSNLIQVVKFRARIAVHFGLHPKKHVHYEEQ